MFEGRSMSFINVEFPASQVRCFFFSSALFFDKSHDRRNEGVFCHFGTIVIDLGIFRENSKGLDKV